MIVSLFAQRRAQPAGVASILVRAFPLVLPLALLTAPVVHAQALPTTEVSTDPATVPASNASSTTDSSSQAPTVKPTWSPTSRFSVPEDLEQRPGFGARTQVLGIETINAIDQTRQRAVHTATDGHWDVYLPFYAYHPAWVYSADARANFHDVSLGLGVGKHWTDANGHQDLVYGMVFEESHGHAEPIVGYARIWNTRPLLGSVRLGAGYTVGITSRPDIASGIPFPLALPLVSAQVGRLAVMSAIVPDTKGLRAALFWARYQLGSP